MFAKNAPKKRRPRLLLEQLEERCVPVASITEYVVPTAGSFPQQITSGPDGNLWFTEQATNKIARITPNGAITDFIIPTPSSGPFGITSGPDGNLWFTEASGNKIGRITTNGAIIDEFNVPTAGSNPQGIASGPDGNLWFTEASGNKIGRITTRGGVTEFVLPTAGSQPFAITSGSDGNLWFTEESGNRIGRITTVGGIIEFTVPTAGSKPFAITSGPDGNLWFTEATANQIGRISTSGAFAEFSIPTAGSNPQGIATGSDGNLWFTEEAVNQIGRVTTGGAFAEFPVPTANSQPYWITSGPDGNLWFTEQSSNNIAKLVPSSASTSLPPSAFPTAKNGSEIGVQLAAANGTGTVILDNNGDGLFDTGDATFTFGLSTDTFVVGDWNHSGFDSVGVVRGTASGVAQWTIDTNEDYAFDSGDGIYNYGLNTDKFVTGDWTGSGTTKIGVVRARSDGSAQWVLNTTGTGVFTPSDTVYNYGLGSDTFITGDWNGAGKTEIGVVRTLPSGVLQWVLNTSGSGVFSSSDSVFNFGLVGDTPVVGDWNGSGKTKIGVVRQQADGIAIWALDTNGDGVFDAGDSVFAFGQAGNHFLIGRWKPPAALLSGDGVLNAPVPALQPDADFRAAINGAILAWEQAGIGPQQAARLENANYRIETLSGGLLGETIGSDVVIDATAQGHGWSEGATPQPRQMDLFTALGHEMGHLLGLPDQATQPSDLMFESLLPGVRKTPTTRDVDAVFAGGWQ
jgi:virginiamycin B lyase